MIEIQHLTEPEVLKVYRSKHPDGAWGDTDFQEVKPLVRMQLNHEQDGLCVYCEGRLDVADGHVEHIKSKGLNPALTFAYDNLAHSCNSPSHCGHQKRRQILPVEPRPGCNRFFVLMAQDGKILPTPGLTAEETQQARESLRVLGLNAPPLARQRKNFADTVRFLSSKAEVDAFLATAPFRWIMRGI